MPGPLILLENSEQRLGLLPAFGGSAAFWEVRRNTAWCPIWRPYSPNPARRTVANFPLVPWSNRLVGGGISTGGQFHPMQVNEEGARLPMHGTGWMHAWDVVEQSATHVLLSVESRHAKGYPFHFSARQHYQLEGNALRMRLEVTSLAEQALPYGLGYHPYFLRAAGTRLRFGARTCWPAEDGIPLEHATPLPPEWDFNQLRELGAGHIDHNFGGCDGAMLMERPDIDLRLAWQTTAPAGLDTAILYRPTHNEWFCYEPVTHITGAHTRPGLPGLRLLAQGENMALEVIQTLTRISP
jgi:aldose 1-epimerase